MRCAALAVFIALGASTMVVGAAAAQPAGAEVFDARADTMQRLSKRISETLTEARLEDALIFIEQVGNLTLEPMWLTDGGATTGLDKERRITITVKDVTLLTLLERVLEKSQDSFSGNTWQLTPSGMVEVGPKERLNTRATVKIYDIHDLTFVVPDFPNVPELDLDTVLQQTSQRGGGGGGGGIFNTNENTNLESDEDERAQEIVDILVSTVEPDQWQQNGGDGATVRLFHGNLLVRAPDYIHRQIGGYAFAQPSAGARTSAGAARERRYVTINGSTQFATPDGEDSQTVTGASGGAPTP